MLSEVEQSRLIVSNTADPKRKSQLGQYFTPARIAGFMAGMFVPKEYKHCRLLDAGAGIGSLSAAFLDRWVSGDFKFKSVHIDAFEIDQSLHPYLSQTLEKYKKHEGFSYHIRETDFIHAAAGRLSNSLIREELSPYTHVILNPPYKKIRNNSAHRSMLSRAGIETVNLYSAFVALSLSLLKAHGQLVAIVPRSFCNGVYYRPFRNLILKRAAVKQIHLFESRRKAFKDDDVLQENIIIRLVRGVRQGPLTISTSTDDSFNDLCACEHPFERIVFPDDPEKFIHIPMSSKVTVLESYPGINCFSDKLDIQISTGPVVDFRVKEHLRDLPGDNSVPLLYPGHFKGKGFKGNDFEWPKKDMKKPNSIIRNTKTAKWLFPGGFYCVVRRFSSKEEKRRVMASVVDPEKIANARFLGFENHLNVFHQNKQGLSKELAFGLSVYLNTTAVDEYFRRFNGHTQVNATDLRRMKYPDLETLISLGEWALKQDELTLDMIDRKLEFVCS